MSKQVGSIVDAKATGSMVLIEMLTAQEVSGSVLLVGANTKVSSPQGYIISIGPSLEADKWGIKLGDRVLLQGTYVPVPNKSVNGREIGAVQPHDIKCVLIENFEEN